MSAVEKGEVMTLLQLHYFCKAYESGSVTKAAQELFFLDLSFIENTIYRIWSPESMHMGTAAIPPDFRDRLSGIQNMLNVEN